jgi:tetratricopeptide (TPR) repeat protein
LNPKDIPRHPSQRDIKAIIFAFSSGASNDAERLARTMVQLYPSYPFGWKALGMILNQAGHYEDALPLLKEAIRLSPEDAEVWNTLGNSHRGTGNQVEAVTAYQTAIRCHAQHPEAHCNLANTLMIDSRRLTEAIAHSRIAITLQPDLSEAYYNLGVSLRQQGSLENAEWAYERSLRIRPSFANGWNNLGEVLSAMGRTEDARISYHEAIRLDPRHIMARVNLGNLLRELKHYSAAEFIFREALNINPSHVQARGNLGNVLRDLKRYDEANAAYVYAICINPGFSHAYSNWGNLLRDLGQIDSALDAYRKAILLQPDFAEAYYNQGITQYRAGNVEAARKSYHKAQYLKPEFAEVHLNLGFLYLAEGRFGEGWPLYEWRYRYPGFALKRRIDQVPEWDGSTDLSGCTLLLYAEQGLGDTIQFSRFANVVCSMGARVILEIQASLVSLMSGLGDNVRVVAQGETQAGYDYHFPLMSLPLVLGTTLETIPIHRLAWAPDASLIARWEDQLGPHRKLRVGLVLSGNPDHVNDQLRSIPWHTASHLATDGVEFICLQKEVRPLDREFIDSTENIRRFDEAIDDFIDTATLCELMDVVISVDTSVAHLSASLGRPTWVILPAMSDWRWMLGREDSPWYPSVRLVRKPNHVLWENLFAEIKKDLSDWG